MIDMLCFFSSHLAVIRYEGVTVGRRYKLVRIEHVIEDCSEGEEGALPGVQDILDDGPPGEGQVGQLHLHASTNL
jgi:hypothetical protein